MPSLVWKRDPTEALRDGYQYDIEEQFVREASRLLRGVYGLLHRDRVFTTVERSREKAIWLLQTDALDSIQDALDANGRKRHRVAYKLTRNVIESLDLAAYFSSGTPTSEAHLSKWFDDGFVENSRYRKHVGQVEGEDAKKELAERYRYFSRFVHRTYRALMLSYSGGPGERLVHDGYFQVHGESEHAETGLVVMGSVSAAHVLIAQMTLLLVEEVSKRGLVPREAVEAVVRDSLEAETVPRGYYLLDGRDPE